LNEAFQFGYRSLCVAQANATGSNTVNRIHRDNSPSKPPTQVISPATQSDLQTLFTSKKIFSFTFGKKSHRTVEHQVGLHQSVSIHLLQAINTRGYT